MQAAVYNNSLLQRTDLCFMVGHILAGCHAPTSEGSDHGVGLTHLLSYTYHCNAHTQRCSNKTDMLWSSTSQVPRYMAEQNTEVCTALQKTVVLPRHLT